MEVFVAAGETVDRGSARRTKNSAAGPSTETRRSSGGAPAQVMQRSGGVIEGLARLAGLDPADRSGSG